MVELGYTQAVDIKLIADSQDNRKGHHGEDNNIYRFIGFVEFVYFTEEVFEFCSIGIDYLLDGRGYHA
jgi:hypothetical protein